MAKFARPNSYTSKQSNQNWTGAVRAANEKDIEAGVAENLYISPATLASAVTALVPEATTTTSGIVELATLAELQGGNAPGNQVPTSNDVATVIAGVVAGAVPPATVAQQGIVELALDSEAVSPYTTTVPNTALIPSNITPMFASPPPIGATTPAAGSFTNVLASGTLGVTGASTLAAVAATNITASGTLGVTGVTTLAAVGATNGTFSGTLAVSGTTTLAAVGATNGTFSGTLGVTGTSTLGVVNATNGTFSGTLGVSGASSFASGTFSTTLGVTGLSTLGDLTQVGTANINASGAGVTTIGTGGTGAVNIGNTTGNTSVTGSLSTTTTLTAGTGITATTGNITTTAGSITSATTLTATLGDITATDGDIVLAGAATQISMNGGAATDFIGTGTLTAGVATILNTNIKATDRVFIQRISGGASVALGVLSYAINVGTSLVVTSLALDNTTETDDVSTFSYFIVNET